jgi:NAD(P)-dependent dehydrogenase (short-subunit alcohol dehydrogenase family)
MSELPQLTNLASTTLNRFRLEQKVAMVIGGSQGLGQAMALASAAAGAEVCVVGLGGSSKRNSGMPKCSTTAAGAWSPSSRI